MKQLRLLAAILVAVISFCSCTKVLIGKEQPNTRTKNFEILWQDFDQHYGAFAAKGIDWKMAYAQYKPMISDTMSDAAFFDVCKKLLNVLDDNHVYLRPLANTGLPWYSGGILGKTTVEDYDRNVELAYLSEFKKINSAIECGKFPGNVGFLNLLNFEEDIATYTKAMDNALAYLKNTKGIVVELRNNDGGEDRVAQYIANRFASERHLSFTSRLRNGPAYDDFSTPIEFFTQPEGSSQYTKPVIVMTDLNTYSSGETFVLAMLQNKNVTTLGDVTGGALSDAVERELPNGWLYRLPIADVRDANGNNLEDIGILPQVKIQNTKDELETGHDKALEKALEMLR